MDKEEIERCNKSEVLIACIDNAIKELKKEDDQLRSGVRSHEYRFTGILDLSWRYVYGAIQTAKYAIKVHKTAYAFGWVYLSKDDLRGIQFTLNSIFNSMQKYEFSDDTTAYIIIAQYISNLEAVKKTIDLLCQHRREEQLQKVA